MTLENSNQTNSPVQISRLGTLGRIHLNRPHALNSLTLDMIRLISSALTQFEEDESIASVLITGAGERAFCAGGDIRALYDAGAENSDMGRQFWREEYLVNARIANYSKPYIAFMDGIVMGGGVGISAHGSHRIVTERTRLAMPETGIGFFPDVGGTWLLSRGRANSGTNEIGTYLALTGNSINGSDAIYALLADHYMLADQQTVLIEALSVLPARADAAAVTEIIMSLSAVPDSGILEQAQAAINDTFAFNTIEDIQAALKNLNTDFSRETLAILQSRSPTSLKLTLKMLRLARSDANLAQSLEREYRAASAALKGHEFYEGVRAAIIDKDRNPHWKPLTLNEVDESSLAVYFHPAPETLFS